MQLRPYQQIAVDSTIAGFGKYQRQLGVLPTGGGKTIVFCKLAEYFLRYGRTLILAHREELVDQAIHKLHSATGLFASKEKAQHKASLNSDIVVASVQSMQRRLSKWPKNHFALLVADEAHHAISNSWQQVLTHFSSAKILGVTATPDRGDKQNLGKYFESIPFEVHLFDLIHQGYLSPISVKSIPLKIDLGDVRQTAGDYNASDLGNSLRPYFHSIAQAIRDEAVFRKTLVFLPLVATSLEFVEVCRSEGLNAEHIDGESKDRSEILSRYSRGEIDVLCNAMLLTEGFDDTKIDCVVTLRPTRSRSLYCQMVGRGTRIAPGKSDLLLLDFLWLHEKHRLIRPAHLIAESDSEADEVTEQIEKDFSVGGGDGQTELDLENVTNSVREQREKKLKAELEAKAKKKARVVNAIDFCLSLNATAAADFEPVEKWEHDRVSESQSDVLEANGIDVESVKCKGHASKIIDLIIDRKRMGLCTPKQMRLLRQLGHPHPDTTTMQAATDYISRRLHPSPSPSPSTQQKVPVCA